MKKIAQFLPLFGAALISSVASAENPFGATELSSGYMQLAEAEMACGANMKMDTPPPKTVEGACAGKKTDTSSTDAKKAAEAKAAAEAAAKTKN